MREIKFRAWDKITKTWINYQVMDDTVMFFEKHKGVWLSNKKYADRFELMQYTGLKDKNGKEIYEGDIIQIPDNYDEYGLNAGEIYQVYFAYGGFRLKPKYQPNARGMWLEDDGEFEVIGNIHENPELLEEGN